MAYDYLTQSATNDSHATGKQSSWWGTYRAMNHGLTVAVVGATGAVGGEFLRLFEARDFPIRELRLLASERSVGKTLEFRGRLLPVVATTAEALAGVDIAFFSAGATRSREFSEIAQRSGATVIDNSSAFRMNPEVPLVVPEVNGHTLLATSTLIANPNCVAAILVMAVHPLRSLGQIKRITVATYQSASGAGAAAMAELENQTRVVLDGGAPEPRVMPHPYAFNLFSHNASVNEHGYNDEEWKAIHETLKILEMPDLRMAMTCVRVPVMRAHSMAISIEFAGEAPSEDAVRDAMERFPGVRLVDDRDRNYFPMPLDASGQDDVLVGRIRRDLWQGDTLHVFASGDQLLKGAALNAVQIAEQLPKVRAVLAR